MFRVSAKKLSNENVSIGSITKIVLLKGVIIVTFKQDKHYFGKHPISHRRVNPLFSTQALFGVPFIICSIKYFHFLP